MRVLLTAIREAEAAMIDMSRPETEADRRDASERDAIFAEYKTFSRAITQAWNVSWLSLTHAMALVGADDERQRAFDRLSDLFDDVYGETWHDLSCRYDDARGDPGEMPWPLRDETP
jgi:hypothetical protein